MSGIAREIHLVVRSTIKADEAYVKADQKKANIITHKNSIVSKLQGNSMLNGITLKDRSSGKETDLSVDGVFAETGWIPNTAFLEGFVDMNQEKEVIIDIDCHTSVPGIFAAGDITNVRTKQIITAAGEGAKESFQYDYLIK